MTRQQGAVVLAAAVLITASRARAQNGHEGHVNYVADALPYLDAFTSTYSPAMQQWLRSNFSAMISYSPYADGRTSWWPKTYVYADLYAILPGSYAATAHPEWILKDQHGNRMYIPWGCQNGTCPEWAGDVANPAFRAYVISGMQAILNRGAYAGLYIDDCDMEFRVSDGWQNEAPPIDTNTGQLMTWDAWRNYIATFLEAIRANFPKLTLVENVIWYSSGGSGVPGHDPYIQRMFKTANVINLERGTASDTDLIGSTGFWSVYSFLNFIDSVHSAGPAINFEQYQLDPAGQEYGLASWFLISNGSDSLGDQTASPSNWFKGYNLDLGSALGPRTYIDGIFQRNFTGGIVLVAEPGLPGQTINLPATFQRLDGSSVTSVYLQGGQGAVLLGASAAGTTPFFVQTSLVNAGSLASGSWNAVLAPGGIISIFGQNLADGTYTASPPLPLSLSDTTVTVGGLPAPLLYASPGQINAMVPFEEPPGTALVTVWRSTSEATLSVTINTLAPGIFMLGKDQGAILTSTGEVAGPGPSIAGLPARPARRGEFISMYLTGLGDVTNRPASGAPAPNELPYSETILSPTVTIGGADATPMFSGLTPSFAGLYQVNVQVPDTAGTGDAVYVTLHIGGSNSNTVTMAVQ